MLIQLANNTSFQLSIHKYSNNTTLYIISVKLKAPWLVKNLLFVVPLNPWLFHKVKDHALHWFTSVTTHSGCWENTRKIHKSLTSGSLFKNFSSVVPASHEPEVNDFKKFPGVLPTSQWGYQAGKPKERGCKIVCKLGRRVTLLTWDPPLSCKQAIGVTTTICS